MIGDIIEDWAAWTWERDKEFFSRSWYQKNVISFLLFLLFI